MSDEQKTWGKESTTMAKVSLPLSDSRVGKLGNLSGYFYEKFFFQVLNVTPRNLELLTVL